MKQQINLYKALPQPNRGLLTGQNIIRLWLVSLGVFTVIGAIAYSDQYFLEKKLQEVKLAQDITTKRLIETTKRFPKITKSSDLENEMLRLSEELESKQGLVKSLNAVESTSQGFSAYLNALSTETVPGLWLTDFLINQEDGEFTLRGNALQSASIPLFLIKLEKVQVFANKNFKYIKLADNTKKPGLIRFVISTSPDPVLFDEEVEEQIGTEGDKKAGEKSLEKEGMGLIQKFQQQSKERSAEIQQLSDKLKGK